MILTVSLQHLTAEKLILQAKSAEIGFLVADYTGKLIAKSKTAKNILGELRIGRPIHGLSLHYLDGIEAGEVKSIVIESNAQPVDATVIKGIDCFAVLLNQDGNGLLHKIQAFSGYDIKHTAPVAELPLAKERSLILEALNQHINPRRIGIFEVNGLLLQIANKLSSVMPRKFNFVFPQKGDFRACGSDRDFITLVVYCCIYLASVAKEGCVVNVKPEEKEGRISLNFFVKTETHARPIARPLNKIEADINSGECLLRYITLLANGNLWDCRHSERPEGFNICVSLPVAENATDCVIKDIDTIFIEQAIMQVIAEHTK